MPRGRATARLVEDIELERARGAMMHLVQYSTGVASAEIAWRLVNELGRQDVALLTADVRKEDPDNWRFAHEVADRLGCAWTIISDGRTPMQVGRDERCVPNNRMAVCSKILKRQLLRNWINEHCDPAEWIIYEGYDWTELDRLDAAVPRWKPYILAAPLAEPPYTSKPDLLAAFRERGIEPPALYAHGFHHANCGGACVRGGQAQWELLLRVHPNRYFEWESEEEQTRKLLGKDVSILKEQVRRESRPLTLRKFRQRLQAKSSLFDPDDWGACGCDTVSQP